MMHFFLFLNLLSPASNASTNATPTPVPELQEEFAHLHADELPEVIVYACGRNSKPCNKFNGDEGCVPKDLSEDATKRACDQYSKLRAEIYKIPCYTFVGKTSAFLGWTKNDTQCANLKTAWEQVNKIISDDPALKDNSLEWRASLFRNTVLDPWSRKQKAVVASALQFKTNGKIKRNQTREMSQERMMAMVMSNLEDYKQERHCGPGLLPVMDKVPVLNQKQQGTCFAHAAASMTDYAVRYNQAKNNTEYGSPLMVALDYTWGTKNETCSSTFDPMSAGWTCEAIKESLKRGFCNKESIEKAMIRYSIAHPSSREVDEKKWLKKLQKEFPDKFERNFNFLENDQVLRYLYMIGDLFEKKEWTKLRQLQLELKQNGDPASSCVQPKTESELDPNILLAMSSGSLTLFYKAFLEGVCVREPFDFNVTCNSRSYKRPSHPNESEIDDAIKAKYPVGISYCANVLTNRSYEQPKNVKDDHDTNKCDPHASMIVGTALDDKGRCTYVVRNSWGTYCGHYDKDYTCKDGNIFIPKENLLKNVFGIDTLKNETR